MSLNVMMTTLLSVSLVHVMFGVGFPSARHFSVTLPPSITVWFSEISVMLGGTAKQMQQVITFYHLNVNLFDRYSVTT